MKIKITDEALRREPKLQLSPDVAQVIAWDTDQPGYGVVVGRTKTTFVVNRRVGDKLKREVFAHWKVTCVDESCDGSACLDPVSARKRAAVMLGKIEAREKTPGQVKRARRLGPTLAEACEMYIARLTNEGASETSIETVQREISDRKDDTRQGSYLQAWLDRPLQQITGKECRTRHEEITADHGVHVANRVFRNLRAIWNFMIKECKANTVKGLPEGHVFEACQVSAVIWNVEGGRLADGTPNEMIERQQNPVSWAKLPAWRRAIDGLSSVRRDYNLVVLLTGLRRTDAATLHWSYINTSDEAVTSKVFHVAKRRWLDVTLPARTMLRPLPKMGAKRAFFVPLSDELVEILERRRTENATMGQDDRGWVFPSPALGSDPAPGVDARAIKAANSKLTAAERAALPAEQRIKVKACRVCRNLGMPPHVAGEIVHMAEPKEDSAIIVAPHRLRDTYTTALANLKDPPLSSYAIDVLTNHTPPRSKSNATAGYIGTLDLHGEQQRVSTFLVSQFKASEAPKAEVTAKAKAKGADVIDFGEARRRQRTK